MNVHVKSRKNLETRQVSLFTLSLKKCFSTGQIISVAHYGYQRCQTAELLSEALHEAAICG